MKKLLIVLLLAGFCFSCSLDRMNEPPANTKISDSEVPANGLRLTADQEAQASKAFGFLSEKGVWGEFSLANGALYLNDPLPVVQAKYNLTSDEVQTIQSILTYDSQRKTAPNQGAPTTKAYISGTVIYLTYSEMVGVLFTAATLGPAALAAALNGLGWMFGGPIGGAVALMMSIIGAPSLVQLAYQIVQAHATHRGIYFGITWNWIFPNFACGTWCGCS